MHVKPLRYKAYISYSHADEAWAAWLQRALESYRVPARLSGETDGAPLPRRISPIFRDREDLSSAGSLTESLIEALRDSEALIVVCSPSAVTSRWVNEEIRQFRSQGGDRKILCMVVDGEPSGAPDEGGCFPPALFDGVVEAAEEPLAADPRQFADGKRLARLKLVAGLLGVRLDELRRRDLRRKRRWQALAALAGAAAVTLATIAVSSRMAELRERENAEQMATFVVDLGQDLKSEIDLETLRRISQRAMQYLDGLDPKKLSPETGRRLGLALRQLGDVNKQQGRYEEALAAYERSRQIFRSLNRQHPDSEDLLFELGQSEYYVGSVYQEEGNLEAAREPWREYYRVAKQLFDSDPDNPRWLLEFAYASLNLLQLRMDTEPSADDPLLTEVEENVRLAERVLKAMPENPEAIANYSNTLAWAADGFYKACDLARALDFRRKTVDLAKRAAGSEPANRALKRALAFRYAGLAKVLTDLGRVDEAREQVEAVQDIVASLLALDPSNQLIASYLALIRSRLAGLMRSSGRTDEARALLDAAGPVLKPAGTLQQTSEMEKDAYAIYVLQDVQLTLQTGNSERASEELTSALDVFRSLSERGRPSREDSARIVELRYLWWKLYGKDPALKYPTLAGVKLDADSAYRSCDDAQLEARLDVMGGDLEAAHAQADYLARHGYRHPDYLRFCREQALCEP